MKTLHVFVVELEKQINDTIKTDSGLELFIDTRFENGQFPNRVTSGPVVSPPIKYNTGVEVGDEHEVEVAVRRALAHPEQRVEV